MERAMNMKYWLFAATLASVACLPEDDKDEEEEEESEPSGEPSGEASSETSTEPDPDDDDAVYVFTTDSFTGDAVVTPGTAYEGTETYTFGLNDSAGTGNFEVQFVWSVSGSSIEAPAECTDCQFAFDVDLTFDAAASTDPDGQGEDISFGYALGTTDEGTTLFYGGPNGWGPWLVDGTVNADEAGTAHSEVVSFDGANFSYSDGVVDYYEEY